MDKPLSGIKVLDLTTFVAAPVCCRLLADMGAEVIKVEPPKGDAWRETGKGYMPEILTDDMNPVFDIYNSGKKHVAINLKSPEGKEMFLKLMAEADVFITNTRPAALKRLGISYEDVKDRFPGLVYGIVLGYGEDGPDKDAPAFDTAAFWSRSGFLRDQTLNNEHYHPVMPPYGVGDTITGYILMGQICSALLRKLKTGKGDYVRASLYHMGIFSFGTMQILAQEKIGKEMPFTRLSFGVPGGPYQCSDGEWIFISVGYYAALIPQLCAAINRPELMEDPRYATREAREIGNNKQEYYEFFRDAFLAKPSEHWLQVGKDLDIPVVRMNHYKDVTKDPQAWANDYLEDVTFANGETLVMPSCPLEMDSVGPIKTKPAPVIGADTDAVAKSLGYSDAEIAAMKASGAIK